MGQHEHTLQNRARNILAGQCLCFRANVGKAWQGDATRLPNGDILLKNPRPFSTGLPTGFSDVFGLVPVTITEDMVGQTIGGFFAIEFKAKGGKVTPYQENFIAAIKRNGGRAGVARSEVEAVAIVRGDAT